MISTWLGPYAEVAAWVQRLTASGLAPATVRYAHRVLSLLLAHAVRDGRMARNPQRPSVFLGWSGRNLCFLTTTRSRRSIQGPAVPTPEWLPLGNGEVQVGDLDFWVEPPDGIEPSTYALRVRRSDRLS